MRDTGLHNIVAVSLGTDACYVLSGWLMTRWTLVIYAVRECVNSYIARLAYFRVPN